MTVCPADGCGAPTSAIHSNEIITQDSDRVTETSSSSTTGRAMIYGRTRIG